VHWRVAAYYAFKITRDISSIVLHQTQFEMPKAKGEGKQPNPFEEFMKTAKKEFNYDRKFPHIDISTLNQKQARIYNTVKAHVENPTYCLRLVVNGFAGTGYLKRMRYVYIW